MTTQTITASATEDMRDVLVETGHETAKYASAEAIHAKIAKTWTGGIDAFLKAYGH
jgi:hypothetical protein